MAALVATGVRAASTVPVIELDLDGGGGGGEQSMASQGMILGGIKYGLSGQLGAASQALAEMPERWRRCLSGNGEVDLRHTNALSEPLCLWSTGGLGARVQTMLASRALRGRRPRLIDDRRPQTP